MKGKVNPGTVFLVPSPSAGSYAGIVLDDVESAAALYCAFFGLRDLRDCSDLVDLSDDFENPIAKSLVTRELLIKGRWRKCLVLPELVTQESIDHGIGPETGLVGATIFGAGLVGEFLDTYFGSKPLESWALPEYVEKFFLPTAWKRRPTSK